jgi:hypothetical protein
MSREEPKIFGAKTTGSESEQTYTTSEKEKFVQQQIRDLELGEKLESYPRIIRRLAFLAEGPISNFSDSVEIAKMVDLFWNQLGLENILDKKTMQLCALLHDIGKTGPARAKPREQKIVADLFSKRVKGFDPNFSVRHFIQETQGERAGAALALLKDWRIDFDIDPQAEFETPNKAGSLIYLFRLHDDWTYDILKNELVNQPDGAISPAVVLIATSHHFLEGKDPANLLAEDSAPSTNSDLQKTLLASSVISMFDQYHALRERAGKDHQAAIRVLEKKVKDFTSANAIAEALQDDCLKIIKILEDNQQSLEENVIQLNHQPGE